METDSPILRLWHRFDAMMRAISPIFALLLPYFVAFHVYQMIPAIGRGDYQSAAVYGASAVLLAFIAIQNGKPTGNDDA